MKLESKDLRCTNLVIWNREDNDVENEIVQIYNIQRSTVRVYTEIEELSEMLLGYNEIEPIPLTEEWLVDKLGFEIWDNSGRHTNEFEDYKRYVLHNVMDGTSNFEVHYITSNYGDKPEYSYIASIDEDERINSCVDLEYIHQLQDIYKVFIGEELTIKEK